MFMMAWAKEERMDDENKEGRNDIALLQLKPPATYNQFIKPANLPDKNVILPKDHPCYITGWGKTQFNSDVSDVLREAQVSAVDHATCTLSDWWGSNVLETMVCAGGDGKSAACQGDAGGPLNCQRSETWEVHGIVSFGSYPFCNKLKKPTVFTRVSAYVDWINSVMSENGGP
ncbi:chymotrypsin-like elastase family member 2A [Protopterus annectens]|uniref:chymotrypsin-like elastase family member 2A n=1 Tax=Protopterus annectens TaxID=7888 RepID=UPI001CFB1D27|nr:chymotrypsin-like elastase family member 2A [Protopterus annectens]